jgi:uncharacterized damage-inducible protein DinB
MPSPGVEQLLYLLDQAYDGDHEHSLHANLRTLRDDDWRTAPSGGMRTPQQIACHVAAAKAVYNEHAFGERRFAWPDMEARIVASSNHPASAPVLAWLRESHDALRSSIAALDDEELHVLRHAHWGEMLETRKIIAVMIEHDLYHAGEINHLRALLQDADRWPGM